MMSVVAIARDLGPTRHSVLHVLGDHLQVVWGALVAFVVVVLLTPAVGGMARLIGAVDTPGGRRVNLRPVPRLGGLRSRVHALCVKRPLYPGFRGYTTYVT